VSQVASIANHLAAVNQVMNRTIAYNETLIITVLHCNIHQKNYVFLCEQHHIDENTSINCAIGNAARLANLWASRSRLPL